MSGPLLTETALKIDRQPVTRGEVLASSYLGGRLDPLRERIADALACEALARQRGEEVDGDRIQDALDEWRVKWSLIAADEMVQWMEAHGLDLDDVVGHLERKLVLEDLDEDREEARRDFPPSPQEVLDLVPLEAVCGGEIWNLIEEFALRAVAPPPAPEASDEMEKARRRLLDTLGAGGLEELMPVMASFEVGEERASWLLDGEAAFEVFRGEVVSPDRLREGLEELRDDLTRFEVISASLPTDDVAREVLCCIRIDRDPFTRAVARAGLQCRTDTWYGSDLGEVPFGNRLLSAHPRDVFGPAAVNGNHVVTQLLSREAPDLDQPEVTERLSERLLVRALRHALTERAYIPASTAS